MRIKIGDLELDDWHWSARTSTNKFIIYGEWVRDCAYVRDVSFISVEYYGDCRFLWSVYAPIAKTYPYERVEDAKMELDRFLIQAGRMASFL